MSQSLMPLEAAGEKDNRSAVVTRSRAGFENLCVDIIDEDRALAVGLCSRRIFLQPEVIGNDDPVSHRCANAFKAFQEEYSGPAAPSGELVAVEFGNNVVYIENDLGARQLWIPGGEDQEVRHIMDVEEIVGPAGMPLCDPEHMQRPKEIGELEKGKPTVNVLLYQPVPEDCKHLHRQLFARPLRPVSASGRPRPHGPRALRALQHTALLAHQSHSASRPACKFAPGLTITSRFLESREFCNPRWERAPD